MVSSRDNRIVNFFSHAIVTGGSSGIGKETARLLVRRGTRVTLLARRPELLASARAELAQDRAPGTPDVLTIPVDVADREAVDDAVQRSEQAMGPCDLLVTSAGMAHPGYVGEIPVEIFEETMRVNYFGTLYPVRAVLPGMRAARRGRIVLVSSGAGIVGVFGYAAYSPSKFALRGLAEVLRAELRRDGIGVSIVYPPDTDTPQLAAENEIKPPETRAIASGAKTWSAEDVARCVVDGIDRGRFTITPGWEMTWLHRLQSVAGPLLAWHFDRAAAGVATAARPARAPETSRSEPG